MLSSVAPLAGAWIEIESLQITESLSSSLPSRERGLKFLPGCSFGRRTNVAPLAGAWIEIYKLSTALWEQSVAPLAGAWIEILYRRQSEK